ncbi:MAG: hypothetical protein IT205_05070 [Fimbriimonadaceae bacterium]|nr:hypothetical protein [Fimbriimonadaceae bacterium]
MITALAALAIASSAAPFEFTPPAPGTKTYSFGDSDTTLNRVDISWKWDKTAVAKVDYFPSLKCGKWCKGEKHFRHRDCDTSCDVTCRRSHRFDDAPQWQLSGIANDGPTLRSALEQFGYPPGYAHGLESTGYDLSGLLRILNDPKLRATWNLSCWNDDPCTISGRTVDEYEYTVTIEVRLYRISLIGETELRTNGPTAQFAARVFLLNPDTISQSVKSVFCSCDVVLNKEHSSVPLQAIPQTAVTIKEPDGETRVATGPEVKAMGFEVVANDMNHASFTMTGTCANASEICIPAGWELDCTDGSAQDTLLVQDLRFPIPPPPQPPVLMASTLATLPISASPVKLDALTMCLEIEKKEPNPKLKYKLVPPRSQANVLNARLAADGRRTTIGTQVRTWIITDNASYDAIAKLLVPVPSPAMYIRELYNAKKVGAIDPIDKKVAAMYSNDLLTTPGLEADVMDDFVKVKLSHDREATLKWIGSSAGKSWAEWFDSVPAATVAPAMDQFIERMCHSGDSSLLALAQMLTSNELAPHLTDLKGDSIGALVARLTRPCDAKLAEALVLALEKTKHPSAKFAFLNADKGLNKSLKERLEKI